MTAPAAAGAIILPAMAKGAKSVVGGISQALTADLAVVSTQWRPRGKRKAPIDLELHLNPAALGIAAVGAGLTLWLMQLRLHPYSEPVDYGYWYFYYDSSHTPETDKRNRGDPPTKRYWVEGSGHYEATGIGTIIGRGWSPGAMIWVEDTPGYWATETATWQDTRMGEPTKRYSVEQRAGYGLPEPLETVAEFGAASSGALSVLSDLIFKPGKLIGKLF